MKHKSKEKRKSSRQVAKFAARAKAKQHSAENGRKPPSSAKTTHGVFSKLTKKLRSDYHQARKNKAEKNAARLKQRTERKAAKEAKKSERAASNEGRKVAGADAKAAKLQAQAAGVPQDTAQSASIDVKPKKKGFTFFRKKTVDKKTADGKSAEKAADTDVADMKVAGKRIADEKVTDKKAAAERRSEDASKELQKREHERTQELKKDLLRKKREERKRRRSASAQKRRLEDYLNKSGFYDANVNVLRKRVFQIALIITALAWLVVLVMGIINGKRAGDILQFSIGLWTAVFAFLWLFIWGVIYFYLEMRIYHRTKELEEVLPDFLQLASSNISAGMPIDRALWLAIRPNFGVLAKEIEDVAKETLSGEDLADSLKKLVKRYDSALLKRSVAIILEGLEAGGELADLLNNIALNIQELKIMRKEMSANVTTYAIFISFASVGIAPVLFALATQLVAIIINMTSSIDLTGATSGMLSINPQSDASIVSNFRLYCVLMLSVTSMMSAAIISVIRNGTVKDGIRNIPIFVLVALAIFFVADGFFGGLLSGFVIS